MTFGEYLKRRRWLYWRLMWIGVGLTCVATFLRVLVDAKHHRHVDHGALIFGCGLATVAVMTWFGLRTRCPRCSATLPPRFFNEVAFGNRINPCPSCGLRTDESFTTIVS
jgi:hypothetical protein